MTQTRIMVVCDQNRARSPLAAGLLARLLAELHAGDVDVVSTGLTAIPDLPVMPEVGEAASALGLDLGAHRSCRLEAAHVAASDLIITMTRAQADTIGVLHDGIHDRLFVLGELAGLASDAGLALPTGPLTGPLSGPLRDRLSALHRRRGMRGLRPGDDVPDPVGHGPDVLRATVERLDALVRATGPAFA